MERQPTAAPHGEDAAGEPRCYARKKGQWGFGMKTRRLREEDLEPAFKIAEEYLGTSRDAFFRWYRDDPDLLLGVYDDDVLISVCFGKNSSREADCACLVGIATVESHWRSGAGSLLIKSFEAQVRKRGKTRISVGSAADLATENFYMKNGFRPTHLCTTVRRADLPEDYRQLGYDFCAERWNGDEVTLVVEATVRDKTLQERMKDDLGSDEAIFIMCKEVAEQA